MLLGENGQHRSSAEMHHLNNPGVIGLYRIEVQSGTYLGEDDITRFEDIYGRALPDVQVESCAVSDS